MKKLRKLVSLISLLFIVACSPQEHVQEVKVKVWSGEKMQSETAFFKDENSIDQFVNLTKSAKKLDDSKIIKTPPMLTYTLIMEDDSDSEYHLWVTEEGEGYVQELIPNNSSTYELEDGAVRGILDILHEVKGTEPAAKIDFE
ncbi:hypothetical protein [Bacillus sp. KH172YL63]|uniref:hypothetical protein n=1 Tax=Bacillus sp. KH172YL63 TaxID=2709784 RepID=UPI0013E4DAC8|nr:hypothetical protein [Bacillus sp. KH172YL63]BCB03963.1 hypothetical protein KH172YL63_20960 [Bacillus sp. KH172YL63]